MDLELMAGLGKAGAMASIALAAVGSAFGTGTAGMASIGAWKKCYAQEKTAPFLLLIFIGAPLTQTIYGMIFLNALKSACNLATYVPPEMLQAAREAASAANSTNWAKFLDPQILSSAQESLRSVVVNWPAMLSAGIFGGLGMGASAWFQGKAGAAASDAIADNGKGFGNYLMTIGIVETVALFVMVFLMINIG